MRRNYKKLTALLITSALLVSFAGCSKNAVQTDGSTGAAESDSISVSDNDTETVVNSTAEEETQEQSTEEVIETSSSAVETDPSTEEDTEEEATEEETPETAETSDEEESQTTDNKENATSGTNPKENTEKETTTDTPGTTKGDVVAQSIKASVSGTHYIGDTLAGADITVVVTMSDGSKLTNPAGWSANPLKLTGASNQITVAYEGLSTTITVNASEKPAETTAAPQPTMPAPTTPAPPETTAPTKTYGLDAVPEGLELLDNMFDSTCLLEQAPYFTTATVMVYHYNDEPVTSADYEWKIGYHGDKGAVWYHLTDEAKKKVSGLENIISPAEGYRITAYYNGIEFDVLIPDSKGYRPDTYDDEAAQLEFALFNQERNSIGLTSLVWNDTLAELAKIRAKELESDYSHNGCFYGASEIITFGFNSEDSQALARGTFASWKGSSGHYNMIIDHGEQMSRENWCGIAYYRSTDGKVYTVAIFSGPGSQIFDGVIERNPAYLK